MPGLRGILAVLIAASSLWAGHIPTIDDLLNVKSIGGAQISPDGKWIAYTISETDWKQNAFVTQIWVTEVASGRNFALTRGKQSASNPHWSPDSQWISFTSSRDGGKSQLYVIAPDGGEATVLTKAESDVGNHNWSRDGKQIAFESSEPDGKPQKNRKEHLGDFEVVRKEYHYQHLWTIDVAAALEKPQAGKQRTKGSEYSVGGFSWSPDGKRIAFSAQRNPDLTQSGTADIYMLELASDSVKKIVGQEGPDSNPHWSPDGTQILFVSAMGKKEDFQSNRRLAIVNADGGTTRSISDAFDEQAFIIDWLQDGIYFGALQKTASHLFRISPAGGKITRITAPDNLMAGATSLSADGKRLAFTAVSPKTLNELYVSDVGDFAPRLLTHMTDQVKDYTLATREVISWKSKDGTVIEGILIKPADFDPTKKYPLLCVIHGGPTGIDRPTLLDARYYPADIWAGRGALVLKVNYRGSAGYGEKFRKLNVRNLGVGDAWDVLSGVDYLISKGWVDPNRMGCMGWSQGGYISAFLTTSSDRFKAISVGAGISNWATYYYNTDITTFTMHYLGADPATDPEIYRKTSPMSYIRQAKTPTLIQHGELDKRVPIPNAYELRQGLENQKVPVEMIVYKGYGHGITKPKSMRAVMEHNAAWFGHYIFGDPAPDFTMPAVPAVPEPSN